MSESNGERSEKSVPQLPSSKWLNVSTYLAKLMHSAGHHGNQRNDAEHKGLIATLDIHKTLHYNTLSSVMLCVPSYLL
jgi:hypothetical protein